jgi:hypothetical protein
MDAVGGAGMTEEIATPLEYAAPLAGHALARWWRMCVALAYAGLVVLPCVIIVMVGQLPHVVLVAAFYAYAFALLPVYYLDHWLLGGRGFHSPAMFGLFTLCIVAMLWPMPLVSVFPRVWRSRRGRRMIAAYAAAFVMFALFAAWWMNRNWALFVG